MFEMGKDHYSE